jgi:hypothetical protein
MPKYFLIMVILPSLFFGLCCKDNGVAPIEELIPGRRDYVWTVDTLRVPAGDMFYPSRIWGGADNDMWIAGSGSPSYNLLWHFDGTSWKRDSMSRPINPSSLWGFSGNDIWLGNSGNVFWRYDGLQWYKFSDVTPPTGFQYTSINGIWGKHSNDVWGVGGADQLNGGTEYRGIIMRFNGVQWQYMSIPIIRIGFADIRQQNSSGLYFLYGWRFEQTGDTSKVYLYDGKNSLREIYSNVYSMKVEEIAGEVYFVSQNKIYKYIRNAFVLWKDFSNENYLGWMVGRSEMDFFGMGKNGDIVHYNGTDIITLFPNTVSVFNLFVVDGSVFVVCVDLENNVNFIIHGKLK